MMNRALDAWSRVIGVQNVLKPDSSISVGGAPVEVPVLRISQVTDLPEIVRIAGESGVPLYPVSTGRNWGYGGPAPARDDCAIVDLSGLKEISGFDRDLGLVTVQPGVSQQILRHFLDKEAPEFLVPVHGGGPECSVLGNALERGYGITPYADHFGALTSLRAILPNGEMYEPVLSSLGGEVVDGAYKWGIGPYLDGLFTQSGFGIVTQATIALARRPEAIEAFFFWVRNDSDLEASVRAVRETLRRVGGVTGMINLMNTRRVLSMMIPYPSEQVARGEIMPDDMVAELARQNDAPAWMGVGAVYGTTRLVRAARKDIKEQLRGISSRLLFVSPKTLQRLRGLLSLLPGGIGRRLLGTVDTVHKAFDLMSGIPSQVALPLAYWKSGKRPAEGMVMNPGRDGCGLIWYSPLVAMKPDSVRKYVQMVDATSREHRIEPLITLTSVSDRCFDSTVPILFDPADENDSERAHRCYEALFENGRQIGVLPYRIGVKQMGLIVDPNAPGMRLAARLKSAIDLQGVLSPGRYGTT